MDANFIGEVSDYLKCIVCHLVLKDPVLLIECGHRFCQECYDRIHDHAAEQDIPFLCPHDRKEVDVGQVVEDKGIARAVMDLQVKCDHLTDGCHWKGELRDLRLHLDDKCSALKIKRFMADMEMKLSQKDDEIKELQTQHQENVEDCKSRDAKIDDLERKCKEGSGRIHELERHHLRKDVDISELRYTIATIRQNVSNDKAPSKVGMREEPVHCTQCRKKDVEIASLKYQLASAMRSDRHSVPGSKRMRLSEYQHDSDESDFDGDQGGWNRYKGSPSKFVPSDGDSDAADQDEEEGILTQTTQQKKLSDDCLQMFRSALQAVFKERRVMTMKLSDITDRFKKDNPNVLLSKFEVDQAVQMLTNDNIILLSGETVFLV